MSWGCVWTNVHIHGVGYLCHVVGLHTLGTQLGLFGLSPRPYRSRLGNGGIGALPSGHVTHEGIVEREED